MLHIETTLFQYTHIGTLGEKKHNTPHIEFVLFHPALNAYPAWH